MLWADVPLGERNVTIGTSSQGKCVLVVEVYDELLHLAALATVSQHKVRRVQQALAVYSIPSSLMRDYSVDLLLAEIAAQVVLIVLI